MIVLSKRPKIRLTDTARIRSWTTSDGRYAVEEINSLYGKPCKRYIAIEIQDGQQSIVARHRARKATIASLTRYVNSVS